MNKKELSSRVAEVLRANNIRKPVSVKKQTFHITDEDGNTADFHIKQQDKNVLYTVDDTANVIDACIAVILDAIKNGEEISIKGFGSLGLHYRAARRTKEPNSGEWCEIEARYIPKFSYGNDLRMAARLYELSHAETEQEEGGDS
ncbi:MAG: HU family DNA-binding protein [Bacteroidaceae bacterium]|nr:HU family DNA-binding protein [Bacteroidaceae bacterium]